MRVPRARPRLSLRGVRPVRHGGPEKADQFACDGDHGDRRALAVADEMAVASMQALLGAPGQIPPRGAAAPRSVVAAPRPPRAGGDSARRLRPGPVAHGYSPPW